MPERLLHHSDVVVTWQYHPLCYARRTPEGAYRLGLQTEHPDPVRLTVSSPEAVELLAPYLALFDAEQRDPWANGPAYLPVERRRGTWHFSTAGALYDYPPLTDSESATSSPKISNRTDTFFHS